MAKKSVEQEIKELEAKYQNAGEVKEMPIPKPKSDNINIDYYNEKYSQYTFPADIQFTNQLLFAIFNELVEFKNGNNEAREIISKEKGK